MGIRIITDSTSEIGNLDAEKMGVTVVALKSVFSDGEYLDGIDLSPEEFYAKLATANPLPTTSQPTPIEFEKVFGDAVAAGDSVIAILLASKLSGTVQSALIAKELCGGDITVIDSNNVTVGLRILVNMAVCLRDAGKTAQEIVTILEEEKQKICLYAAVDTLEYLQKGGRLSKTAAFAGTLLNLKPLITIKDGELQVAGKCRGMQKAYDEIFKLVEQAGGIDFLKPIAIGYTGDKSGFHKFVQVCSKHLAGYEPIISSIGSVIGTHAGPGAVVIAFFKDEK